MLGYTTGMDQSESRTQACHVRIYYKDRKCAVNENPSVRIELERSKTSILT